MLLSAYIENAFTVDFDQDIGHGPDTTMELQSRLSTNIFEIGQAGKPRITVAVRIAPRHCLSHYWNCATCMRLSKIQVIGPVPTRDSEN
jgi:hypothetical protein